MDKILVKLYVPVIEQQYEIWIPANKRIYNVIGLLTKAVSELSGGYYKPNKTPGLYDKAAGKQYDINLSVKETAIRNGAELVLI